MLCLLSKNKAGILTITNFDIAVVPNIIKEQLLQPIECMFVHNPQFAQNSDIYNWGWDIETRTILY